MNEAVEVDLHGYTLWSAIEVAHAAVQAAWERGYESVRLVHGARMAHHHWSGVVRGGYGSIKWALRSNLRSGQFEPYSRGPHSRKHVRGPVVLTVALRPNRDPMDAPWPAFPEPEHDRHGR